MPIENQVIVDFRCFVGEGRYDMQTFRVDVRVRRVRGRPVEGSRAEAIDLDFVRPNASIQTGEVILVYQTKLSSPSAYALILLLPPALRPHPSTFPYLLLSQIFYIKPSIQPGPNDPRGRPK